jgi:hypothetical protein
MTQEQIYAIVEYAVAVYEWENSSIDDDKHLQWVVFPTSDNFFKVVFSYYNTICHDHDDSFVSEDWFKWSPKEGLGKLHSYLYDAIERIDSFKIQEHDRNDFLPDTLDYYDVR